MRNIYCIVLLTFCLLLPATVFAQEGGGGWRDEMLLLVYSPRYFGPNAFPMPELRSGKSPVSYEVEARYDYHDYVGDQTKDLFLRALLPIVKGRAGVEVRFVVWEDYLLTPATRDERHTAGLASLSYESHSGDVELTAFFQLLESERWCDAMFSLNIKTASGGRLCDARFTDAASYWVDVTAGRDLFRSPGGRSSLRLQAMAGFYCWMTNDMVHRQNDAISFGGGLTGVYRHFTLSSDLSGFAGYANNGDRPLQWRNNLRFEYKSNILSLRYVHGMQDSLYETWSAGYIRRF
jgi:hypothetical protein